MLNKFDKPATMRTRENRKATMPNPLEGLPVTDDCSADCFVELEHVLAAFRECDAGQHRGPFAINSPNFFTIVFESYKQREAFRKAMSLTNHGEQYWDGAAFFGTLDLLKSGKKSPEFSARPNPFLKLTPKKAPTENAIKYSHLRAEVKKVTEKMELFIEDRTWIAVCFPTPEALADAFNALGLPPAKFVHIEDLLPAIEKKCGVTLNVPAADFALRAEFKRDKALCALVGD